VPRTWLITGSSRGLGRALAEVALAAGENVVATARNPDQLKDLVGRYPGSARAVRLDVTDRAQAVAAVKATTDAFGRLDVLVNNAGYANVDAIEDFAEDDFRAQIETNLWGVINLTRAAVPVLREQSCGHILQISSVGGRGDDRITNRVVRNGKAAKSRRGRTGYQGSPWTGWVPPVTVSSPVLTGALQAAHTVSG
jgi:NAD(P)-dependent dehydrogenase (short-subunit alcohol dehydrogenase family)